MHRRIVILFTIALLGATGPIASAVPVKKAAAKRGPAKKAPAKKATRKTAAPAKAAGGLAGVAKAYATQHKLPIRVVKNDLGTRQVERIFVPVLPDTHDSFLAHFKIGAGAIVWRGGSDLVHPALSIEPGYALAYGSTRGDKDATIAGHNEGGYYLTLGMSRAQLGHWERFMDKWNQGGVLYTGRESYTDPKTKECYGSCMWWLVHGEVSAKLNLAHYYGVRRAKGPEVLAPRLIHAGNDRVGPVGIAVASIAEFKKMTNEQLLGPEPAGGAAEQVKE